MFNGNAVNISSRRWLQTYVTCEIFVSPFAVEYETSLEMAHFGSFTLIERREGIDSESMMPTLLT